MEYHTRGAPFPPPLRRQIHRAAIHLLLLPPRHPSPPGFVAATPTPASTPAPATPAAAPTPAATAAPSADPFGADPFGAPVAGADDDDFTNFASAPAPAATTAAPTDAFGAFSSTQRIVLAKGENGSFGFGFEKLDAAGIQQLLVTKITPGGVAEASGQLQLGQPIVSVNGQAMAGVEKKAAIALIKTANQITLELRPALPEIRSGLEAKLAAKQQAEAAEKAATVAKAAADKQAAADAAALAEIMAATEAQAAAAKASADAKAVEAAAAAAAAQAKAAEEAAAAQAKAAEAAAAAQAKAAEQEAAAQAKAAEEAAQATADAAALAEIMAATEAQAAAAKASADAKAVEAAAAAAAAQAKAAEEAAAAQAKAAEAAAAAQAKAAEQEAAAQAKAAEEAAQAKAAADAEEAAIAAAAAAKAKQDAEAEAAAASAPMGDLLGLFGGTSAPTVAAVPPAASSGLDDLFGGLLAGSSSPAPAPAAGVGGGLSDLLGMGMMDSLPVAAAAIAASAPLPQSNPFQHEAQATAVPTSSNPFQPQSPVAASNPFASASEPPLLDMGGLVPAAEPMQLTTAPTPAPAPALPVGGWLAGRPASVPNLAEMLRADKTAMGTLIQSPSPFWLAWGTQLLSQTVDFIFIDTEHTPINRHDLSAMCNLYKGAGLPCLVRVVDAEQARQALDGGASGVVCPYMETVGDVKALRGAVKLRPFKGARLAAALATGQVEGDEIAAYVKKGGEQRALVLNIESQAAIDNLESMLAPELEVDAVLIGPHDLSCNLGIPEQYDHPKFQEAVKTIFSKARAAGVGAMIHHIGELFGAGMQNTDAGQFIKWGCNNVVTGGDLAFFLKGLKDAVSAIRNASGETVADAAKDTPLGVA